MEALPKRDLLEAGMGEIPLEVLMEYMLAALMSIEKLTSELLRIRDAELRVGSHRPYSCLPTFG